MPWSRLRRDLPRLACTALHNLERQLWELNSHSQKRPPLAPEVRAQLQREFAPEVERLSDLLQRDPTYWSRLGPFVPRSRYLRHRARVTPRNSTGLPIKPSLGPPIPPTRHPIAPRASPEAPRSTSVGLTEVLRGASGEARGTVRCGMVGKGAQGSAFGGPDRVWRRGQCRKRAAAVRPPVRRLRNEACVRGRVGYLAQLPACDPDRNTRN
jgi:hypothetical protein